MWIQKYNRNFAGNPAPLENVVRFVRDRIRDPLASPACVHLMGPTGCGKTVLLNDVAARLGIQCVTVDCSELRGPLGTKQRLCELLFQRPLASKFARGAAQGSAKPRLVVVDGADFLGGGDGDQGVLATIANLVRTASGMRPLRGSTSSRGAWKKGARRGAGGGGARPMNPLVFTTNAPYCKPLKDLKSAVRVVKMYPSTRPTQRLVMERILRAENLPSHLYRHFLDESQGNLGHLVCQTQFFFQRARPNSLADRTQSSHAAAPPPRNSIDQTTKFNDSIFTVTREALDLQAKHANSCRLAEPQPPPGPGCTNFAPTADRPRSLPFVAPLMQRPLLGQPRGRPFVPPPEAGPRRAGREHATKDESAVFRKGLFGHGSFFLESLRSNYAQLAAEDDLELVAGIADALSTAVVLDEASLLHNNPHVSVEEVKCMQGTTTEIQAAILSRPQCLPKQQRRHNTTGSPSCGAARGSRRGQLKFYRPQPTMENILREAQLHLIGSREHSCDEKGDRLLLTCSKDYVRDILSFSNETTLVVFGENYRGLPNRCSNNKLTIKELQAKNSFLRPLYSPPT